MSEEPRFHVDVEAPSDARWDKLEQRLMAARARDVAEAAPARNERRGRPWLWAAAGAIAAAALTIVAMPPRRELVHGPVTEPAAPIAVEGPTRLTVGDATILAGPGARLEVAQEFGAVRVKLARGEVDCEVAPRGARPPFFVEAADVTIKVVGTRFVVRRPSERDVSVEVTHGTVQVTRGTSVASVTAGQAWHDGAVVATATAAAPSGPTGPTMSTVPGEGSAPGAASAPGEPQSRPTTAGKAELERAESIEATNPAAARHIYESLLDAPNRGVAARARYSLAFADFRAERYESAARHAARYQRQFPTGKNAEDVLRLEILSYYHLDDPRRREAARRYLDAYPTGAFAEKARQIANWQ